MLLIDLQCLYVISKITLIHISELFHKSLSATVHVKSKISVTVNFLHL